MTYYRTRLVIGCGYLGSRVARAWVEQGDVVYATTRNASNLPSWSSWGLRPLVCDVTRLESLQQLPAVDTVLFAVGFDHASGATRAEVYVEGLKNVLQALPSVADRWIHISSTGVYGSVKGAWIDEETACHPQREAGQACWLAENALRRHTIGTRTVCLRLAGIYGPGRIPQLDRLRNAQPLHVSPTSFVNLIHVDDAVSVVLAADRSRLPNDFVVSDGEPALRRDFYAEIARRLGVSLQFTPEQVAEAPTERSRQSENKRVCSAKLRRELSVAFRYPTFREGLAASLPIDA